MPLGSFEPGRREFLARVLRVTVGAVMGGPMAAATVAVARARAAGRAAVVLCSGRGPVVPTAVLVRGCSALATALQGVGGTCPVGLDVDFRRTVACLVTGAAPRSLIVDSERHVVAASPASDWALIGLARGLAPGPWRLTVGSADRTVSSETAVR